MFDFDNRFRCIKFLKEQGFSWNIKFAKGAFSWATVAQLEWIWEHCEENEVMSEKSQQSVTLSRTPPNFLTINFQEIFHYKNDEEFFGRFDLRNTKAKRAHEEEEKRKAAEEKENEKRIKKTLHRYKSMGAIEEHCLARKRADPQIIAYFLDNGAEVDSRCLSMILQMENPIELLELLYRKEHEDHHGGGAIPMKARKVNFASSYLPFSEDFISNHLDSLADLLHGASNAHTPYSYGYFPLKRRFRKANEARLLGSRSVE